MGAEAGFRTWGRPIPARTEPGEVGGFEAGMGVALPAVSLDWPGGAEASGARGCSSATCREVSAGSWRWGPDGAEAGGSGGLQIVAPEASDALLADVSSPPSPASNGMAGKGVVWRGQAPPEGASGRGASSRGGVPMASARTRPGGRHPTFGAPERGPL